MDKMKKLMVLFSFIFIIWFSSAYAPRRAEWNCSTNDDEEMKSACEIEKQFFKFTETTWTRVMSTTCCTYEEHQPKFYYYFHNMRDVWEIESWNVKKLDELVLKLTSQIYSQSKNKLRTLNILSWLFNSCSEKWKTAIIKSVCNHFSYDMIWRNPKLSNITFSDIINSLKYNKLTKRSVQFSDLDEIYTPINYHYASIRHMYMIWDYALWLLDWSDYFKNDEENYPHWKRIVVMKAWDTLWQDFAEIDWNIGFLDNSELTKEWNNLIFSAKKELWSDFYREWILEWKYKLNGDWSRSFIDCNIIQQSNRVYQTWDRQSIRKEDLSRCENELWVKLKTILK